MSNGLAKDGSSTPEQSDLPPAALPPVLNLIQNYPVYSDNMGLMN